MRAYSDTILQLNRNAAERGDNTVKSRWKRAAVMTERLQGSKALRGSSKLGGDPATVKLLESQHWLEMIDTYVMSTLLRFG